MFASRTGISLRRKANDCRASEFRLPSTATNHGKITVFLAFLVQETCFGDHKFQNGTQLLIAPSGYLNSWTVNNHHLSCYNHVTLTKVIHGASLDMYLR